MRGFKFIVAGLGVTLSLLMLAPSIANAQALYLADFSARVEGEEIYVSWTTQKGFTCENIEVQMGTDSTEMATVYTYLGICGGELKEEHYFYRIPTPIYNKVNYIRLNLGLYGFSRVVNVKPHKAIKGNVLIFPQPANGNSTILFDNPQSQPASFVVYNSKGQIVSTLDDIRTSQIKAADLNLTANGLYFVHLIIDDTRQIFRLMFNQR